MSRREDEKGLAVSCVVPNGVSAVDEGTRNGGSGKFTAIKALNLFDMSRTDLETQSAGEIKLPAPAKWSFEQTCPRLVTGRGHWQWILKFLGWAIFVQPLA